MDNEAQRLVDEVQDEADNTKSVQAPSGEWDEYNVYYLQVQARLSGVQEMNYAIGECQACKYLDKVRKSDKKVSCKINHGYRSQDWYCADFERKEYD